MGSDEINKLIDQMSSDIAKEANKCCYRSDGWEEELKLFISNKLKDLLSKGNQ